MPQVWGREKGFLRGMGGGKDQIFAKNNNMASVGGKRGMRE